MQGLIIGILNVIGGGSSVTNIILKWGFFSGVKWGQTSSKKWGK